MNRIVLFESDNIKVIQQDFGSSTVFVTFNEAGLLASGETYWGDFFFEARRKSAVGVMSKVPNWYPPDCMREAAAAIRATTQGRRVVTYGFSQGGYGALKFAAALGAAAVLAFSPKWSINPDDVRGFDTSKMGYYRPDLRNGHKIETQDVLCDNYIFYDPLLPNDTNHATRLQASCASHLIVMPFTGHETIRLLTESGLAETLVMMFAKGAAPAAPAILRQLVRQGRRRSATYSIQKSDYLLRRLGKVPADLGYMTKHLASLSPQDALLPAAFFALHRGDLPAVQAFLDEIADQALAPRAVWLWNWCRHKGFLAGEIRAAEVLRTQFPNNAFERLHGVSTSIQSGDIEAAIKELQYIASDMEFDFRDVRQLFFKITFAIGRLDLFQKAADCFIERHIMPPPARAAHRIQMIKLYVDHQEYDRARKEIQRFEADDELDRTQREQLLSAACIAYPLKESLQRPPTSL